ncbi:unnamed protein product [Gongylonema pulchrum]|uniref:DSS1/SEM1 family protein n=1 Tax=Gongylonema pulchrum TaxID=637853 RepID=A0A183EEA5_9BILA|nr:unnamed protein product [Gongylonema pulchrum]
MLLIEQPPPPNVALTDDEEEEDWDFDWEKWREKQDELEVIFERQRKNGGLILDRVDEVIDLDVTFQIS